MEFPNSSVIHLPRVDSDHAPLLIKVPTAKAPSIRYFRFLNLWTKQDGYNSIVQEVWSRNITGDPFWKFHQKLIQTCSKLSIWPRSTLGDIFTETKQLENEIVILEDNCLTINDDQSRAELNKKKAELTTHLKIQESYWR